MVGPADPKRRPPEQHREGNTPAPAVEPPPKPKVPATALTEAAAFPLRPFYTYSFPANTSESMS